MDAIGHAGLAGSVEGVVAGGTDRVAVVVMERSGERARGTVVGFKRAGGTYAVGADV